LNNGGCSGGPGGACATAAGGYDICFPTCPNTSYCVSRWPGLTCQSTLDTSGTGVLVCAAP
jgi:hypothetical protein